MASRTPGRAFASAVAATNLRRIYSDHVAGGISRGRDGVSPSALQADLRKLCSKLSDKLASGEYSFIQYREHLFLRTAGKPPRVISVPAARDRISLRALADFLKEVYPHSQGVIPQVRVHEVRQALDANEFNSYLRLDIRNFYPSIRHDRAEAALRVRIKKDEPIKVLLDAIRTPTVADSAPPKAPQTEGIPQGLAISNLVAELVMRPVDQHFLSDTRCRYFRFVDDILILCDASTIDELDNTARALLSDQGLEAHPRDTDGSKSVSGTIAEGFDFLGYAFKDELISVRSSSVRHLEARIAREFTRYKRTPDGKRKAAALRTCQSKVNLAITGCIYENNPFGWLHYFRQMNDLRLLKKLDATVESLRRRFSVPAPFAFKSFMRAYWSIKHPHGKNSGYIPTFDGLDLPAMRALLEKFLGADEVKMLSDRALPDTFRRTMRHLTSELEHDIGHIS